MRRLLERKNTKVLLFFAGALSCRERWNQVLSRGLQKGRFSEQEDEAIRKLATDGAASDWREISKQVGGRTPKQCRERWQNSLDPTLSQEDWSTNEDALL